METSLKHRAARNGCLRMFWRNFYLGEEVEDILEKGWINVTSNATLGFSFERIWTAIPPKLSPTRIERLCALSYDMRYDYDMCVYNEPNIFCKSSVTKSNQKQNGCKHDTN